MQIITWKTVILLASIFVGSSVASWAYWKWEGTPITRGRWIGGSVVSGFAGLVTALLLYDLMMPDRAAALAGVSLLAGIGGASTIDFLMAMAKRFAEQRLGLTRLSHLKKPEDGDSNK